MYLVTQQAIQIEIQTIKNRKVVIDFKVASMCAYIYNIMKAPILARISSSNQCLHSLKTWFLAGTYCQILLKTKFFQCFPYYSLSGCNMREMTCLVLFLPAYDKLTSIKSFPRILRYFWQMFCKRSHFVPSENTRKPEVFWCFQGVSNGNIGQTWVTYTLTSNIFSFFFVKTKRNRTEQANTALTTI